VTTSSTVESCNTGGESNKKKDHLGDAIDSTEAEPNSSGDSKSGAYTESIEPTKGNFVDKEYGKRRKSAVLNFSGCKGVYVLPDEFRAKYDEHRNEKDTTEQDSVNDEHQELDSGDTKQNPEKEDGALESHQKLEHVIIKFIQPSCSSSVNKEVCLVSNLSIFRFGHNFIVDATISKIIITNLERPMKKDNLLVRNTIIIKHIGQHIVPFR